MTKRFYASEIATCDLDRSTRARIGGGIPTDNQAALQSRLALASPTDPVTLIIDAHLATSTVILPGSGNVMVRGDAPGARIMAVPGTNGHVFQSIGAPQHPFDPGPPPRWKVVAVGDFDADGKPDLAWRRQDDTGDVRLWLLDGATHVKKDIGLPPPAPGWKIIGAGDFDADGKLDLAWRRQDETGEVHIWLLDGAGGVKKDVGLPPPASGWKVIGVADFDGDGKADLAWRRENETGEVRIWLLDGLGGVKKDVGLPPPASGWEVIAVADFDGDGKADLAWRRQDETGEVRIWLLDGAGGVKKDMGLPAEHLGSHVRFENLTIDGFLNVQWYPDSNSNVTRHDPGWSARGFDTGPWFTGLDLSWLDVVELKDVIIYDAPSFGVRFNRCRRVRIQGGGVEAPSRHEPVLINPRRSEPPGASTDGYHFDGGCEDVVISDVTMATGDDAIAINSDEGFGLPSSRFLVNNVLFQDCRTGLRVHGSWIATHQVVVSNLAGTIRRALVILGNDVTSALDVNHSLTVSHADVRITGDVEVSPTAMVFVLGNGGTLTLNDVKQAQPVVAAPFLQFGTDQQGQAGTISEVALNDCAIYRSDSGHAAAYVLEMPTGNIGTLVLKNFRVIRQRERTYGPIPCLLNITGGLIGTLIVEGLYYTDEDVTAFLNDIAKVGKFGGTGLVATGLHIPAARTLRGARFLNADDAGRLYENIGGDVCVKLAS